MYSTIESQTSVEKGFFSSLHGLLISLPSLEKNDHVIKSFWTARSTKIGNAQLSMNEFLLAVAFLDLDNNFPEIFLKVMLTTSIGRPFISGTVLFESINDDCELKFINRIFEFTDLGISLRPSNL